MWRSLFYAVGIGLFGMGVQGLVLDNVLIHKNTRLQNLIRKIVSSDGPRNQNLSPVSAQSVANTTPSQGYPGWNPQPNLPQAQQSQNSRFADFNTGSRYGPSRFSGPAYGTGYGGARVSPDAQNRSNFGIPFGQQGNTQLAGYEVGRSNQAPFGQQTVGAMQNFVVREWMPWSLLASGAIIFLYTRSIDRRRNHD